MTEEELAQVQAELATAKALVQSKDEEIESLKKSVRGGNDLAKKTKELEKEKSTAETSVTDLHERLEKVEASEKAATEKAEKAHEILYISKGKFSGVMSFQICSGRIFRVEFSIKGA